MGTVLSAGPFFGRKRTSLLLLAHYEERIVRYRLSFFRRKHAIALIAVAFVAWIALLQLPQDSPTTTTTAAVTEEKRHNGLDLDRAAKLTVAASNRYREQHDLTSLEVNARLAETARYFAGYMARGQILSHG